MAQQLTSKAKRLANHEVKLLLDLISKYKIITNKATNATSNRLKDQAWKSVAKEFSIMTGEMRREEQLRWKWDNMKKAARKRCARIRQYKLKVGCEKTYFPPDETLDRVASMLGATCSESTIETDDTKSFTSDKILDRVASILGPACGEFTDESDGDAEGTPVTETVQEVLDVRPLPELPQRESLTANKRHKRSDELQRAQKEKELAMAAYFRAMTEKVELEKVKLQFEIEQLKRSPI